MTNILFIQLTTLIGNEVLININNITNIIDYSNCPRRIEDENTRIYTNDGYYTAVKEPYSHVFGKIRHNFNIIYNTKDNG